MGAESESHVSWKSSRCLAISSAPKSCSQTSIVTYSDAISVWYSNPHNYLRQYFLVINEKNQGTVVTITCLTSPTEREHTEFKLKKSGSGLKLLETIKAYKTSCKNNLQFYLGYLWLTLCHQGPNFINAHAEHRRCALIHPGP